MGTSHEHCQDCDPAGLTNGSRHMTGEEKRTIIEAYVHAFNAFDVEGMVAYLHPDARCITIVDGVVTCSVEGIDYVRSHELAESARCSSRKKTVMECYERGEQVVLELSYSCVLAADQAGGLKSGDTVTLEGIAEVTFIDEKVSEVAEIFSAPQLQRKTRK